MSKDALMREAIFQFAEMVQELYPGYDRGAIDNLAKAMQEKYRSLPEQVETAIKRAKEKIRNENR